MSTEGVIGYDMSKANEPGVTASGVGLTFLGPGEDDEGCILRYRSDSTADLSPCGVRIHGGNVYVSHPAFMSGRWMQLQPVKEWP